MGKTGCWDFFTVRQRTIATASLRTDSPNTIANTSGFTPSLEKTVRTVTGSVAEMRAPQKKNSILRYGEKGCATYGRNTCLGGEMKYRRRAM